MPATPLNTGQVAELTTRAPVINWTTTAPFCAKAPFKNFHRLGLDDPSHVGLKSCSSS